MIAATIHPRSRKQSRTAGLLEATIAGIPCLIEVETCNVVKGSYYYNAPSDWDYYGYTEIEFAVFDRKGYKAAWLERKMSDSDKAAIEAMILQDAADRAEDY